jgi:hypothetical protein
MVRSNMGRDAGGWHEDFMRQQQQYSGSSLIAKQPARNQMAELGYLHGQAMAQNPSALQPSGMYREMNYHLGGREVYQNAQADAADNSAFEAAFAQAEGAHASTQREAQRELSEIGEVAGVRLDPIFNTQTSHVDINRLGSLQSPGNTTLQTPPEPQSTIRIGSDAIPATDLTAARTAEEYARDCDELARTAGQLLKSVADDTSSKFQESQFLTLMRRIRDREVELRGQEFHDVDKTANGIQNPVPSHSVLEVGGRPDVPAASQIPDLGGAPQERPLVDYERALQELEAQNSGRLGEARRQFEEEKMNRADEDAQALHPGGSGYPVREGLGNGDGDDDRHKYDHWASGGIGVEDERIEESPGLAGRFSRAV